MSAVLEGGGGNIEILYHHFTRIQHRHSFSSPSFRLFHYHLHAFTRKTHSEQKQLLDSLSVHFTERLAMGGPVIRHEPATTALLELYPEVYQIFLQAGWLGYFQRLQGFEQQQVLQFAQNLQEDHSIVQGVRIPVTEEDIAQVSGLPTNGIRWFSRKHIILNAQQDFFLPGEQIEPKGRGVRLSSLPPPWPKVAKFVKHYLTCEGRYQVVYQYDFVLLSHLRHARLINIPYYLLGCLKNMSHYCKKAKNPTLSLTHHRLTQLLIQKGFSQQNPPLNNPPIDPQEAVETPENLQEQQPQNPPDPPEVPNSLSTDPINPINSPTIPSPPHILPESSTPAVHILSDDSEPDNSPCPIIEEEPPRKRKQIPFFPPFLQRKRTRASTRAATIATALNLQPIRLQPRTPSTSQILESLPIPPTGTETQEPEAQYVATSSVSNLVAETQEPTTHLVAETQEPATTHSVAETQEPATHLVAETQEPATHSVAETQEPATELLKHKNQLLILLLRHRNQMPRVLQHYSLYIKKLEHKNQLSIL
jgi:hypothetical protein